MPTADRNAKARPSKPTGGPGRGSKFTQEHALEAETEVSPHINEVKKQFSQKCTAYYKAVQEQHLQSMQAVAATYGRKLQDGLGNAIPLSLDPQWLNRLQTQECTKSVVKSCVSLFYVCGHGPDCLCFRCRARLAAAPPRPGPLPEPFVCAF